MTENNVAAAETVGFSRASNRRDRGDHVPAARLLGAPTSCARPSPMPRAAGAEPVLLLRDLLELKVIKSLLGAGIKLEQVRTVFTYLKEHLGEDVTTANLVISGTGSVLVRTGEELIDALRSGQESSTCCSSVV